MLHEMYQVNSHDKYFVIGGNPDGNGGGVIVSTNDMAFALSIQKQAIKLGYTKVQVVTWTEL